MSSWPNTLVSYHRTDEFTNDSIPEHLLEEHTLSEGVWGMIRVLEGEVIYHEIQDDPELTLSAKRPGFVEPEVAHYIEPRGEVRFYIELFRDASSEASSDPDDP